MKKRVQSHHAKGHLKPVCVDGLHVSPRMVPRVDEALHEAGILEGARMRKK